MTSIRKHLRQVLRLVVQQRDISVPLHGGGEVRIPNRFYVLQAQDSAGEWRTVPMINFDRLPVAEQEGILGETLG